MSTNWGKNRNDLTSSRHYWHWPCKRMLIKYSDHSHFANCVLNNFLFHWLIHYSKNSYIRKNKSSKTASEQPGNINAISTFFSVVVKWNEGTSCIHQCQKQSKPDVAHSLGFSSKIKELRVLAQNKGFRGFFLLLLLFFTRYPEKKEGKKSLRLGSL